MSEHEDLREWTAAYVLGALELDERTRFERHLDSCGECQREVTALAPVPGLLSRIEPGEAEPAPAEIAERVAAQVRSERHGLVTSRRRWQWATAAAVIVLLFVALSGGEPDERIFVAVEPDFGVTGQIGLDGRGWGTEVTFQLADLPADVTCIGWAVDTDGEWQQVAWWGPTASHRANVTGASSLPVEDVAAIVVTTTDRDEVVTRADT